MRRIVLFWCFFLVLTTATTRAFAASQEKVLNEIANFAERVCNSAPIKNESEELQLSGEAKLDLTGLLRKISGMGVTGAAKYKKASYVGVLQADVAKLISKDADCKTKISDKLIDKLIPSAKSSYQDSSKKADCDGNPMPLNMAAEIDKKGNVTTITERSGGNAWVTTVEVNGENTKVSCAEKQKRGDAGVTKEARKNGDATVQR